MTLAERELNGVPRDYTDPRRYETEQVQAWHRQRERFMCEKTMATCSEEDESILVICGWEHCEGLRTSFQEQGCEVDSIDLTREPWYLENWDHQNPT